MNNFGVCESNAIPITPCAANEYRDANRLCQPCPSGCKTCTSATTCTSCILPSQAPAGAQCVASCGNGFKASNEQCDDNNAVGGDGCSSTCTIEENYRCDVIDNLSVCRWAPVSTDCGNRQLNAGETCDDGNRVSGDGCSSTCK
jgi:cysteine-rich repeat protein